MFFKELINLLFPIFCIKCGKSDYHICLSCLNELKSEVFNNNYVININTINLNTIKGNNCVYYKDIFYLTTYKNKTFREMLHLLKYNNQDIYAKYLALLINQFIINILSKYNFFELRKINNDIVFTIVPMHQSKILSRGYNQCDIIMQYVKNYLNINYIPDLLIKQKKTKAQSSLSEEERYTNLKGAFVFNNKYDIKNKDIILFDDVFTTGNTLLECAKIYKKQKCKNVFGLVLLKR